MTTPKLSGAMALVFAGAAGAQAYGQTLEDRVRVLEDENRRQAAQIAEQKQMLEGAPGRVKDLGEAVERKRAEGAEGDGWFKNIEIAGLIEVEAFYTDPFQGSSESDIVLATFELGVASQVTDWVEIGASLLYEEDDTDLEVDLAFITIANPDVTPLFMTAGQIYVPFGAYETNLVSDPLTLEIGETRETTVQVGFVYEGFSGSVYGFNGDNKVQGESQINDWGANLAFTKESDDWVFSIGAGYINDLGDSDAVGDAIAGNREDLAGIIVEGGDALDMTNEERSALGLAPLTTDFSTDPNDRTGGWTANLGLVYRDFTFIAEYLSATGRFDPDSLSYKGKGAEPSAWNLEIGYSFPVFGKDTTAALAYQGTDQALGLDLPKQRWLVGWSIGIFDNTALSFEYAYDTDYSVSDGGTGENGSTVVGQLAVEF